MLKDGMRKLFLLFAIVLLMPTNPQAKEPKGDDLILVPGEGERETDNQMDQGGAKEGTLDALRLKWEEKGYPDVMMYRKRKKKMGM